MKSTLLILFCSCIGLLADNAVLILPQRVQFYYPDEISLIVEADKFGKLGSLSLTLGKKKLVVDEANMSNIYNPNISKIGFQQTYDEKLNSKIWIVSLEYGRLDYSWGTAFSAVQFIFSENGYSRRITKIPVSLDSWKYLTKPAKGMETKYGMGGDLDTGNLDAPGSQPPDLKGKSGKGHENNPRGNQ